MTSSSLAIAAHASKSSPHGGRRISRSVSSAGSGFGMASVTGGSRPCRAVDAFRLGVRDVRNVGAVAGVLHALLAVLPGHDFRDQLHDAAGDPDGGRQVHVDHAALADEDRTDFLA